MMSPTELVGRIIAKSMGQNPDEWEQLLIARDDALEDADDDDA